LNADFMPGNTIKILVTGAMGQLGGEFRAWAGNPSYQFLFTDLPDLDLVDKEAVNAFIALQKPDFCINCAAYTAVDKAEIDQTAAYRINVTAVEHVASACRDYGICLLHISTDFVFPGNIPRPLTEDDPTGPLNYYGITKLEGEKIALKTCPDTIIVRTSWLYSGGGRNFVNTMLRLAGEREIIDVVSDQVGSPTYAGDLASALVRIITVIHSAGRRKNELTGVYHFSNEGAASWYDFAKAVYDIRKSNIRVNPVLTRDYPTPARRPYYSVLDKSKIKKTFEIEIPYWRQSLVKCLLSAGK
jgi:dTDP-4-dehydrorhamnose reductase